MAQHYPYPVSAHCRPPQASPPAPPPYPQATPPRAQEPPARQVLLGGLVLALAALIITPQLRFFPNPQNQSQSQSQAQAVSFTCLKQENPRALVSRDQVRKLLETDLQTPRVTLRETLKAPYCVLSPGQTEAGQPADREAYPLEFDPQTWLVVLYQGDRYVGYDFRFR